MCLSRHRLQMRVASSFSKTTFSISRTHNLKDLRCHVRICPQRTGPQSTDELCLHATITLAIEKIDKYMFKPPLGVSPRSILNAF